MLTDPWFYAAALPAVVLVGLSKGGLGGASALVGVPLMALVIPPVQAAAILLPILILMDLVSLWLWRGNRDWTTLRYMLPGALLGIAIGWLLASIVTESMVRLVVGIVALVFAVRWFATRMTGDEHRTGHSVTRGSFWGMVSGFTSFVAHAGGPPFQVYALALGQEPRLYVGTSVIFFAVVNAVKLVPYFALGQFDAQNLTVSLALMPAAPIATFAGAWIVRRMNAATFYPFMYGMVFIVALKLIYDGAGGLLDG